MIETLLQMSGTGAAVILAVLLLRLCLRRVPKIFSYALWAIVLFRLLCPVSVSLPVSVFNLLTFHPLTEVQTEASIPNQLGPRSEPGNGQAVFIEQEKQAAGPAPGQEKQTAVGTDRSGQEGRIVSEIPEAKAAGGWRGICTGVWLAGVFGMLAYGAFDMARLRKTIRGASLDRENIYLLNGITSPFVAGIVRPKIYLPYGLTDKEREYVLLHERTHIRRGDPLFRMLAFLALALHWFNPFVWVAFFVSGRDMEMSCDEMVLRRLGVEIRCEYSNSLLVMAQGRGLVTNISLAFGEGDTGKRIKNVLNYKKATAQVLVIGALVVALALAALGTNPVERASAEDLADSTLEGSGGSFAEGETAADQKETLSMEMLCQMADDGSLKDCDFRRFANFEYVPPEDDSEICYDGTFTFTNESGEYEVSVACLKIGGENGDGVLDSVLLKRCWDNELIRIYGRYSTDFYRTGTPPTGEEILAFLDADFDIMREISFELPEGLTMEPYNANTGYLGGRLFSPDVYEGEDHTPPDWMASGMVSRFDAENLLSWEDGQIVDVHSYRNHAVLAGMYQVDDLDAPAMLVEEEYDLHTASEMYEMDQKGIAYEPTSRYWCLYIAKEGAPYGYIVTLNQKNFTEDDMLSLAKTIRLADNVSAPPYNSSVDVADQSKAADDLSFLATISVRTLSRSLPGIDRYVGPDEEWEKTYGDTLVFADNCKYFINYGREGMSAQEVNFVKFAEAIEEGSPDLNKPCEVEIHEDKLVYSITLISGRYLNGVSYAQMGPWGFFEDTAALYPDYAKQFPIVRTETMDIASAPGEETIEIRRGRRDLDGIEEADIDFRDQEGNILYSTSVVDEGMCLENVYVGRMDGAGDPFILEVRLENRDTYGEYSYYVYTLGGVNGTYMQTAGSRIEWEKDGPLVYDAGEMTIFFHMLGHYLADSHLLAGTAWNEDGIMEIRTDPVCDEDLFTYANCRPPCFADPYEGADVR